MSVDIYIHIYMYICVCVWWIAYMHIHITQYVNMYASKGTNTLTCSHTCIYV